MSPRKLGEMSSAIYGTIMATAVIAALSEDQDADPLEVAGALVLTSIVFWLAHVYSQLLAASAGGERVSGAQAAETLVEEWPMVRAAVAPLIVLVLGALGVMHGDTAISLALGTSVASLFVWGLVAARRQGRSRLAQLAIAAANCGFGLLIVGLKLLVH